MYYVEKVVSPLSQSLSTIKNMSMSSLVQCLYLSHCWLTPMSVSSLKKSSKLGVAKGCLTSFLFAFLSLVGFWTQLAVRICADSSTGECLPWARQDRMVRIQNKAVLFAPGNMQVFSWKGLPYPIAVPCSVKTVLGLPWLDSVEHQDLLFLGLKLLPRAQTQPEHEPHSWRMCSLLISL